jgi:hypothetical protein
MSITRSFVCLGVPRIASGMHRTGQVFCLCEGFCRDHRPRLVPVPSRATRAHGGQLLATGGRSSISRSGSWSAAPPVVAITWAPRANLEAVAADIARQVRVLDGLMRYRFRTNAELMGEWAGVRNPSLRSGQAPSLRSGQAPSLRSGQAILGPIRSNVQQEAGGASRR